MSSKFICDRCGADAVPPGASRPFLVPLTSPGTKAVALDATITLTVTIAGLDLCPVCLASALVEYVRQPAGAPLALSAAQSLSTRLTVGLL